MSDSRMAAGVGAFVAVTVVVLAVLVLIFSKGLSVFADTYTLKLRARNVGGLKSRSSVQIAGVEVGRVVSAHLGPLGRSVIITVQIDHRFQVHSDARFVIEQIGFLGDQFVAIYPTDNKGRVLQEGDTVECEEPFNLQQVARSAVGFIQRVDETAGTLNEAITRVNRILLNEQTLTNFALAAIDFRALCERGRQVIDGLDRVVRTNAGAVSSALSNVVTFSAELDQLAADLRQTVDENRSDVHGAVQNLRAASASVAELAKDLEQGRGLGGALLKDDQVRADFTNTMAHLAVTSTNLTLLTSNLNRFGLLYKPKPPKDTSTPSLSYPGRNPFKN